MRPALQDGRQWGLDNIDPAHADHVAALINNQRRRQFDYQSPAALYAAATVH